MSRFFSLESGVNYFQTQGDYVLDGDSYFVENQAIKIPVGLRTKIGLSKNEIPIGTIIVSQNKIIARAYNLTERLNDVTAHAEVQAITAAANYLGGKYLINCTLYVTIEPCVMCVGALFWSQISKVVIGAKDEQRGFSKNGISLHPKTEISWGLMEKECSEILLEFFKTRR